MQKAKLEISKLQEKVQSLVAKANFSLRPDVLKLIRRAYRVEKNKKAKKALGWILDNAAAAWRKNLAICQDTGLPIMFIEAGTDTVISSSLVKAVEDAVGRGYKKNYLRASIVNPFAREKSSYQGCITHIEFSSKAKGMNLTFFPKGFGSENKCRLKMFNPTAGTDEIIDFIVDSVAAAGAQSCPPFFVGVGIGGSSDIALLLAKKALLGPMDQPNPDKFLRRLEKKLLKRINYLKIGPMGLGGRNTALAVKVKTAPTHIAGLPVGVNISCHALRSATMKVKR